LIGCDAAVTVIVTVGGVKGVKATVGCAVTVVTGSVT
jgi:hypothetical protein